MSGHGARTGERAVTCQVFLNLGRRSQSVARELFNPRDVVSIKQHCRATGSTELTTVPRRKRKHIRRPLPRGVQAHECSFLRIFLVLESAFGRRVQTDLIRKLL